MDNKLTRDFAVKFNELNSDNQRYIIAIQQAEAKKAQKNKPSCEENE